MHKWTNEMKRNKMKWKQKEENFRKWNTDRHRYLPDVCTHTLYVHNVLSQNESCTDSHFSRLSVCLSVCLSVFPSVLLSFCSFVLLSLYWYFLPSIYLFSLLICLLLCPLVSLLIFLYFCPLLCIQVFSVSVSVSFSFLLDVCVCILIALVICLGKI